MPTYNELYQRARGMGLNHDAAHEDAIKLAGMPTLAQPQAAPPEPPAFTFDRYNMIDRTMAAQMDRNTDPQRAAHAQRELARIDAELETVNAQVAALEQRRRELVEAKRPYLFTG